jgi:hypothetical protein
VTLTSGRFVNALPDDSINKGTGAELGRVTVPPGSYVVLGTVFAQDSSQGFANTSLQCLIREGTVDRGAMYQSFAYTNALMRMSHSIALTVSAVTDLSLYCGTSKGASTTGEAVTVDGEIHAIKVANLHHFQ